MKSLLLALAAGLVLASPALAAESKDAKASGDACRKSCRSDGGADQRDEKPANRDKK
jgi:hypothetical protein